MPWLIGATIVGTLGSLGLQWWQGSGASEPQPPVTEKESPFSLLNISLLLGIVVSGVTLWQYARQK
jgi:hypothetical protein